MESLRSDDDSESDSDCEGITLAGGLSADTLAALFKFVKAADGADETDRPTDTNAMAQELEDQLDHRKPDPILNPTNFEATDPCDAVEVLRKNGVVRLDNILSHELCDACLTSINVSLQIARDAGVDHFSDTLEMGFGNVDSKKKRWDMYLHNDGPMQASMQYMFGSSSSVLSSLFATLFYGLDPSLYEYSSLISDSGAESQRLHSDTTFQEECSLYTVFIALQDITSDMGPTVFIPGSNTEEMHREFRLRKNQWIAKSVIKHGLLRKGDVAVMDSRTFHCASANCSSRRALFYFTLLNPKVTNMGEGSMFDDMKPLSLSAFGDSVAGKDVITETMLCRPDPHSGCYEI